MKKNKGVVVKRIIRAIAMTSVSSTTRYLAYQPDRDAKLVEKYLTKR